VANPETPWGRPGPPQVGDGKSVTSGAVRGIKGAWGFGEGGEGLKLMVVWKGHTGVLVCLDGRYTGVVVFGLAS
jgi:hypothetical protein